MFTTRFTFLAFSVACQSGELPTVTTDNVVEDFAGASDTSINPQSFLDNHHPSPCPSSITSLQRTNHRFVAEDTPLEFAVQVANWTDEQWIEWSDEAGNILEITPLMKDGSAHLRFSAGDRYPSSVTSTLKDAAGHCSLAIQHDVHVCQNAMDNPMDSDDWMLLGDAHWGTDNWLELTHNAQASQGAMVNPNIRIPEGAVSISFTIQTGDGINKGADGLALTIIDVDSPKILPTLVTSAPPGGGLGYGVGAPTEDWRGEAITIEFDTWPNIEANENYDPTEDNHIAITRSADPSAHELWSSIPEIEDFTPHDIQIDISPELLRVTFDGEEIMRQRNPEPFVGGYVFLSGSTGWATNHHRVSDLEILYSCL